jgi:hypothetical protein
MDWPLGPESELELCLTFTEFKLSFCLTFTEFKLSLWTQPYGTDVPSIHCRCEMRVATFRLPRNLSVCYVHIGKYCNHKHLPCFVQLLVLLLVTKFLWLKKFRKAFTDHSKFTWNFFIFSSRFKTIGTWKSFQIKI